MRQEVQETRIILVEDDRSICGMVCDYLAGEGYRVEAFYDGRSAIRAFPDREGDALALIDLMLPDVDGMEVIRSFRQRSTIPIIIITAKDDDADKAMGLNLGADDYVVKPFSLIELSARIRANIRRATQYDGGGQETVRLGDLEIDAAGRRVWRDGMRIELTRTEFDILFLMASNPGRAFSKENLYEAVWKEPYYGNENVLNTHMNRLRAKLKDPKKPGQEYIRTIWGIGYRVEAPADASEGRKS